MPAQAAMDPTRMALWITIVFYLALAIYLSVAVWARERRREREAFYRLEVLRKLIDAGKLTADELFARDREAARAASLRRRHGLRLGGLVTVALGAGALVGVWSLPDRQVRAAACIPIAMGLVLFLYSWFLPREGDAPR